MNINIKYLEFMICIGKPDQNDNHYAETTARIEGIAEQKHCKFIKYIQAKELSKYHSSAKDLGPNFHLYIYDNTLNYEKLLKYACSVTYDRPPEQDDTTFKDFNDIPSVHRKLCALRHILHQPANDTPTPTILFTGETGSGKSFAAQQVAEAALNGTNRPFITLNCASLDKNNIDSTLYGVIGGSFTGVPKDAIGYFEAAENGIIFLDEIGELPLSAQAKLLTVLQNREFYPYGPAGISGKTSSIKPKRLKCAILFGTNKDLIQEVKLGNFREDLYHRISTIEVSIPSLKTRMSLGRNQARSSLHRIEPRYIIDVIRERFCNEYGDLKMSDAAIMLFRSFCIEYSWPGNFRDLHAIFARVRMYSLQENKYGIISHGMLERACNEIAKRDIKPNSSQINQNTRPETIPAPEPPTCKLPEGLTPIEEHTLRFFIASCRDAKSLKEAAFTCYKGIKNKSNISSKLITQLKHFGYVFDLSAENHLRQITL